MEWNYCEAKNQCWKNLCSGTQCGGFQFLLILDLWDWRVSFHAAVVFGLGKNLLSKSILGCCATTEVTLALIWWSRVYSRVNDAWQSSHLKGFNLSWTPFTWSFKMLFCVKEAPQCWQSNLTLTSGFFLFFFLYFSFFFVKKICSIHLSNSFYFDEK